MYKVFHPILHTDEHMGIKHKTYRKKTHYCLDIIGAKRIERKRYNNILNKKSKRKKLNRQLEKKL